MIILYDTMYMTKTIKMPLLSSGTLPSIRKYRWYDYKMTSVPQVYNLTLLIFFKLLSCNQIRKSWHLCGRENRRRRKDGGKVEVGGRKKERGRMEGLADSHILEDMVDLRFWGGTVIYSFFYFIRHSEMDLTYSHAVMTTLMIE